MERNHSLDLLRILACLGVIMIHTSGSPIHHHLVEPGTLWFNECLVMDILCRWSVPVFAMITGFFMLDPGKEISIKNLFTKYLARIVAALVFWSFFYAITLHKPFYPIGSQSDHFWYLGMLIGLYLSIPILRLIVLNKTVLRFFCWCWLALMTYIFLGKFFRLPFYLEYGVFGEYPGYCLFAYLLKTEYADKEKSAWPIYLSGIIGLLVTVLVGLHIQSEHSPFYSYSSPNVIFTSLALFLAFVRNPLSLKGRMAGWIETVSRCTFGIYLIHLWLLIHLFSRIYRFIPWPIPLSIISVGAVFCIGFVITCVVKQIPILNKYIV